MNAGSNSRVIYMHNRGWRYIIALCTVTHTCSKLVPILHHKYQMVVIITLYMYQYPLQWYLMPEITWKLLFCLIFCVSCLIVLITWELDWMHVLVLHVGWVYITSVKKHVNFWDQNINIWLNSLEIISCFTLHSAVCIYLVDN